MNATKGYYSLIQYCPDASRLEAANIGVLLFCPEIGFLKARMSKTESRVRQFFGLKKDDDRRINSLRRAIEERLSREQESFKDLRDLEGFIGTRAGALQITPPRSIKVSEPERELANLFEELVRNPIRKQPKATSAGLRPIREALSRAFADPEIRRRLREHITVEVPALRRPLTVPYGYQNGVFNLIQPVSFRAKQRETLVNRACVWAVEGHSIAKQRHPELGNLRLVIVGEVSAEQEDAESTVKEIFAENEVRYIPTADLGVLQREILTTARLEE